MNNTKTEKLTLEEFKIWLKGVEEFQPKDWTPTKEQWHTIKEKMMNIKVPRNTKNINKDQQPFEYNGDDKKASISINDIEKALDMNKKNKNSSIQSVNAKKEIVSEPTITETTNSGGKLSNKKRKLKNEKLVVNNEVVDDIDDIKDMFK